MKGVFDMVSMVKSFNEFTPELQVFAGGKGGMLDKLFQGGYPVAEGFVILPSSFQDEKLNPEAWSRVQIHLHGIRKNDTEMLFAVRSSALSEDSAQASFAGEFETVLNIKTDQDVLEAMPEFLNLVISLAFT
jgi:pyruvate,water dikinase